MTARPGAYVHVPYCAHRCAYCSFVAVTGRETEGAYFDALVAEARARAGELKGLTGIDAPYETPENPDLVVDTTGADLDDLVASVLALLTARKVIE